MGPLAGVTNLYLASVNKSLVPANNHKIAGSKAFQYDKGITGRVAQPDAPLQRHTVGGRKTTCPPDIGSTASFGTVTTGAGDVVGTLIVTGALSALRDRGIADHGEPYRLSTCPYILHGQDRALKGTASCPRIQLR